MSNHEGKKYGQYQWHINSIIRQVQKRITDIAKFVNDTTKNGRGNQMGYQLGRKTNFGLYKMEIIK